MVQEGNRPDRRGTRSAGSRLAPATEPAGSRRPPHLLPGYPTGATQGPFPPRVPRRGGAQPRRRVAGSGWPFAAVALAVAVLALLAIPAEAACEKSKRVSHRDAECLSAGQGNRAASKMNSFHVQNMCPAYGRVVARVDLRDARDRTLTLDDGARRDDSTIHRIGGIFCCSDSSTLCNRSDVVTDAGCRSRFVEASSAIWTCGTDNLAATASISGESYNCTITAGCEPAWAHHSTVFWTYPYMVSSITVPWTELDEVSNCDGVLTLGPCPAGRAASQGLSVADVRAVEGRDGAADFRVTIGQARAGRVTVDYATADGTARAGSDYRAARGTLTFAPGGTAKTVSVELLDDAIDEGNERFVLRLSNPTGARIADGEAVGTIANGDPVPKAWIARFGRTVAEQVVDAVSDRLLSGPSEGTRQVTLGGRAFDLPSAGDPEDDPGAGSGGALSTLLDGPAGPHAPARGTLPVHDLLSGSAFHLSGARAGAGRTAWTAWGRFTTGGFDGATPGTTGTALVDGRVTTGTVGLDAAWDRWLVGMALSVGEGAGSWGLPGAGHGRIESSLTGVWPYLRYDIDDRVRAWGLVGYGTGKLTIARADGTASVARAGLDMRLAAAGLRGALLEPARSDGFALAVRADAILVQIASAAAPDTAATQAGATRLRLLLEGSRSYRLDGSGRALTPGLELGLRHDGGDAETGAGVEAGARLRYADPGSRLAVDLHGRTLLAHSDPDFDEWIASASLRLEPDPSGRGLSLNLSPSIGTLPDRGTGRLLSFADSTRPPAHHARQTATHLDTEAGYGLKDPFGRGTTTPYAGVALAGEYRTWRTGARWHIRADAVLGLELTRSELPDGSAEHGILFRAAGRW